MIQHVTDAGIALIVVLPPLARRVPDRMAARGTDIGYFAGHGQGEITGNGESPQP